MNRRVLKSEEYDKIREIAILANATNLDTNFEDCYMITLLYYLMQFGGLKKHQIPPKFVKSVMLLYKNPYSSYIHYRTEILYSDDIYAKNIKQAEIDLNGGDDPRCPW